MKSLYKISLKIAREFVCENNQINEFDKKTNDRLNFIIGSIVLGANSDYEYIYDPDHVLNPGNGYRKTEEGWSKGKQKK